MMAASDRDTICWLASRVELVLVKNVSKAVTLTYSLVPNSQLIHQMALPY